MNYYVLWAGSLYPGEAACDLESGKWGGLEAGAFIDGAKLPREPSTPIEIDICPDLQCEMPPLFVVPALVVRKDLAKVLEEAGVDNIDYYPAMIRNRNSGIVYEDYLVGNILGILDVIDMEKSIPEPDSEPDFSFYEKIVINNKKCQGKKGFD